jgi:AcrR family transcriptional regulator
MSDLHITIQVPPALYIKNPDTSELGKKIIKGSIELIDQLGFEDFTFKKLGEYINVPESSIYRYFKNKHLLLFYLINWYWNWLDYKVYLSTLNIGNPQKKLDNILNLILGEIQEDKVFSHVNEKALSKIIPSESVKVFYNKKIKQEEKMGFFEGYKSLIKRISDIISDISPQYSFPRQMATTILEGMNRQKYYNEYLPSLIDHTTDQPLIDFYKQMITNTLKL